MGHWPDIALALLLALNLVFAIRLERRLRHLRAMQAEMAAFAPQAEADLREALASVRGQIARMDEAQSALDSATTAAQALRRDLRRIELERLDDVPVRDLPARDVAMRDGPLARGMAAYAAQAAQPDSWPAPEAMTPPVHSVVPLPIRSKAEQALAAALRRRQ